MGERVTTENAVWLLAVMDKCGATNTPHGAALSDLLDARRERDEARAQTPHWATIESRPGNRCYQLQMLHNGLAHGIARVWDDSGLWFVTDRNRNIPALTPFATHHEAARAVCDALGLPFITAGLPDEVIP